MSLLSKLLPGKLTRQLVSRTVQQDLLNGRGNLHEDYPSDFSQEEKEDVGLVRPLSMTSPERLVTLSRAVEYVVSQGIGGDIVECGVWRGGSMLLVARKLVRLKDTSRKLFLFDTFEGMSEPGKEDVSATDQKTAQELLATSDKTAGANVWCYSSLDEVKNNMAVSNYPAANIRFVQGKVEDTLPEPSIDRIALLRLDTDWYESTRHELETLYDKLVPGGVLIIDDYGHWSGARKAVDEFINRRNLPLFLQRIDYTGRMAIKP
jgi:O-methyltransferase